MKILYISYCTPYTRAFHAGGQTFNFYIRQMARQQNITVDLISFCDPEEVENVDLEEEGICTHLVIRPKGIKRLFGRIVSINSKYNPCHKYCTMMTTYSAKIMLSRIKELRDQGYFPDVIILEWTQILFMISEIKDIYPKARYIASEHDVTFLGMQRKAGYGQQNLAGIYKRIRFENTKKRELACLNQCDFVFAHNNKDYELLVSEGIRREKADFIVPFYHKSEIEYKRKNNNILFFGHMGRMENITAVIWFAEKVMPKLADLPCEFHIIGGGGTEELRKLESGKIKIIGFVESIDPYFSEALCFVSPLIFGAGIKVKVIEALYSGITVLTNRVGIEGIPVTDRENYYHCEEAEEYADIIRKLFTGSLPGLNARQAIVAGFSMETAASNYRKIIMNN